MSQPANTKPADDDWGPDQLSDPTFVPCRDERCFRMDLHREHEILEARPGRKIHEGYDKCPECQTAVIVTKTRRKHINGTKRTRDTIVATCPECGWTHTKALKRIENA